MKRLWPYLVPAALLGMLFAWGRFVLVEPADMIAMCLTQSHGWCQVRQMIIEIFVHQRIGWIALALAILATLVRKPWLASAALAASVMSLLLYTPEPGAVALLLALLVLTRFARSGKQLTAVTAASAANTID